MSSGVDESGTVVWQLALCLLLSWVVIFVVLIKGIGSLGKVYSIAVSSLSFLQSVVRRVVV